MMRARLLPATIAVTGLLLATKLAGFGADLLPPGLAVFGPAAAAATPESEATPPPARLPALAKTPPAPPPDNAKPPPAVSEAELRLLQDLRSRRQELDTREQTLQQREQVLDAAQQRVAARVSELSSLQARLEQLEKQRQEREEANWAGLVKTYEVMKPREAAAILNDMDLPVLLQVFDRMKEAKAAVLLGAMQADRARLLTTQLAAMRTRAMTVPALPGAGG